MCSRVFNGRISLRTSKTFRESPVFLDSRGKQNLSENFLSDTVIACSLFCLGDLLICIETAKQSTVLKDCTDLSSSEGV